MCVLKRIVWLTSATNIVLRVARALDLIVGNKNRIPQHGVSKGWIHT